MNTGRLLAICWKFSNGKHIWKWFFRRIPADQVVIGGVALDGA
jgi:hypothetical protein